jgi:hypothetical protein
MLLILLGQKSAISTQSVVKKEAGKALPKVKGKCFARTLTKIQRDQSGTCSSAQMLSSDPRNFYSRRGCSF